MPWSPPIQKRATNFGIAMNNASGIDAEGPWFDGVSLLKGKKLSTVNVEQAKSKSSFLCIQLMPFILHQDEH